MHHFVKEQLRVRHYVRYMDDFVLLADGREEGRRLHAAVQTFLAARLHLELAEHRTVVAPLAAPRDFLGYVHFANGRVRVRRRSVCRLWRRIPQLATGLSSGMLAPPVTRSSLASWLGLAGHADAFRLSRDVFMARDVRNLGKRLLVQRMARAACPARAPAADIPRPPARC